MKSNKKKTIVLCGSMIFMDKISGVATDLKNKGFKVIAPSLTHEEVQAGAAAFEHLVEARGGLRSVPVDDTFWMVKGKAIRGYLKHIERADGILVCNYTKGKDIDRIGDNTFLEMSVGFYLRKKLFVLNGPPYTMAKCEEVIAMRPTFLFGKLNDLQV